MVGSHSKGWAVYGHSSGAFLRAVRLLLEGTKSSKIDLTGGADQTLSLDGAAVREMTSANQLTIDADAGDTIQFAAADGWTQAASSSLAGYEQYSDGVSNVFITDTVGITVDGVV